MRLGLTGELLFVGLLELQGGRFELEVIEAEAAAKGDASVRCGDERSWGHGDEGSSGVAGLDFEAMPEGGGDLAELALGDEVEIKKNEGEVAVAEEEIGAFKGLLGFGAAEPDEVAACGIAVRGGVEGVVAIDEGDEHGRYGEETEKYGVHHGTRNIIR